jgi:NADH-quinone oxidoreductase subunit G
MITIHIDGKPYSVEAGGNLLDVCNKLGIDVPYFCYHPALGSVGSCRLCAVKRFRDANDTKGRITMSCMEPVSDGMLISVNDEEVKNFRASVIEGLMTNHPHDCPVCDEGGECHLQDMVVMSGHSYRRYEHKKRTYTNQNLGPNIHHEMNRCIQCYRCVRYYKDYAGGTDFGVFGAHNHLYFGRFEEGTLESEFSGNLVEVCPTGVFTDKTLKKHYTRKWDLTNAPSICHNCAVGCNTIVGERYGQVRRTLNRFNADVNGYFLCDKGRFGYEYVNAENRIKESVFKATRDTKVPIGSDDAVQRAKYILSQGKAIGIGSPNASVEANFALQKLVGSENFYAGIESSEFTLIKNILSIYKSKKVHIASLKEIEDAEAVIVLGEDILITAPRVALSVRQAVKNKPMVIAAKLSIPEWNSIAVKNAVGAAKGPLFIATPNATKIDDIATTLYRNQANDIARLGNTIAACISNIAAPAGASDQEIKLAKQIAETVKSCKSVMVITGTQLNSSTLIDASVNVVDSLNKQGIKSGFYCAVPEANSLGLGLISEKNIDHSIEVLNKGGIETVIILENDLYSRTDKQKLDSALNKVNNIIVLDHTPNEFTEKADLLLSSGTFAESEGTLINAEGRMQRFFSVLPAKGGMRQSWKWLGDIHAASKGSAKQSFDQLLKEIATVYPVLAQITNVAPGADYREGGMKIPRQTQRFSGRASLQANINVSEPKPPQDSDSALAYSMEGVKDISKSELTPFYWSPGWNSVQASNKYLKELDNVVKAKGVGIRIWE